MSSIQRRTLAKAALATFATAALPWPALADDKPVRFLVGWPAGGSFDALARILADAFRAELNRPVLVENRAGAGGRIVVDALKTAPTDGSVIMLGMDALTSIYPYTVRKLNYDPAGDMVPVGTISEFPFALSVNADLKLGSMAEYVAWIKQNPARFNIGVPALGGPHHFYSLLLADAIGVKVEPVVFQGSAPIYQALFGGHINAAFDGMTSMVEYHRARKLQILAVVADRRMPQVPEVPTFAESGFPGIQSMGFNSLYAPRGTPPAVVAKWNASLAKALAQPQVRDKFLAMGFIPVGKSTDELLARTAASQALWGPIVKKSGFTAD